jgi:hypothetical protein
MSDFNDPYPDEQIVQAIQAARARWWTLQGDWYDDCALELRARLARMGLGVSVFDGILEVAIREGRAPLELARLFDGYLGLDKEVRVVPNRFYRPKFTRVKDEETGRMRDVQVPYTYRLGAGDPPKGNVSYNALRLARTEMTHLFHKGTVESAKNAPWLRGFKWQLSNTHASRLSKWNRPGAKGKSRKLKKAIFRDICDTWATQDIDDLGEGMYRPDGSTLPQDHPNGMCTILKITLGEDAWLDKLKRRRLERLGVPYPPDQPLDQATYERLRDSVLSTFEG